MYNNFIFKGSTMTKMLVVASFVLMANLAAVSTVTAQNLVKKNFNENNQPQCEHGVPPYEE